MEMMLATGTVDVNSSTAYDRQEAIVKMLIETGKVNADSKDSNGHTPLWWAVQCGREAIMKMLIETGRVDVDSKASSTRTPLS